MAELPPLATVEQLADWMQRDPGGMPASAGTALAVASDMVREAAGGQHFVRSTTTAVLYPGACGRVQLLQVPVVSVDQVLCNGAPLATGWRQHRNDLIPDCGWPVAAYRDGLRVTYTHGYATVPAWIVGIVLAAAARTVNNPGDIRQETVGAESYTYAAETIGVTLAPVERDQIKARFRRP